MQKKRILIVDDDISLTQLVKINLEETGDYEVLVQNRSNQALASARAFRPDIILLDYIMPGMDGGDVSASLHRDPFLKDVPVIMVTALVSAAETSETGFVRRGGHLMMAKPIRLALLQHTIETCLSTAA